MVLPFKEKFKSQSKEKKKRNSKKKEEEEKIFTSQIVEQ